jgi:putative DNA primase/helicase
VIQLKIDNATGNGDGTAAVRMWNDESSDEISRTIHLRDPNEKDELISDIESAFGPAAAGEANTRIAEFAAEELPVDGTNEPNQLREIARQLTDIGNAARFEAQHGRDIRYCYPRGQWLCFDGTRWRWDERGKAVALAMRTALAILDEAQAESKAAANATDEQAQARHAARAAALLKWALTSQKRDRIMAMLALAMPGLAISTDQLDTDPMLLNCGNGTVDLRTGELHRHRREDFITKQCLASYRPDATAPTFQRFLARIFRAHPSLIPFMQRAIGYAATGSTREQCLFFLFGRGANGKTTLIDAAMLALGDYAAKADPDLLMQRDGSAAHPCNVADLLGRRMVVCAETNEGRRFDESRLKDLVGETRLKARFMRQDFFEFAATHKIFLYSNHKPTVRGTDFGFWRRMRMVPFVETISDDEKDSNLPAKLAEEVDGILAWIVAGSVAWHREGLNPPPEVNAATADYRTEMDSIGAFLADCCIEAEKLVSYAADLYAAYVKWCDRNGEHALSQKRLGTTLAERGYVSTRCGYSDRKMWRGIGLKAGQTAETPNDPAQSFG